MVQNRTKTLPLNIECGRSFLLSKAMVSWFLGWRSDRSADIRADRKIKYRATTLSYLSYLLFIFDRPTSSKRLEKNPPTYESTDHGLRRTIRQFLFAELRSSKGNLVTHMVFPFQILLWCRFAPSKGCSVQNRCPSWWPHWSGKYKYSYIYIFD